MKEREEGDGQERREVEDGEKRRGGRKRRNSSPAALRWTRQDRASTPVGDRGLPTENSCSECFYYGVLGQYGITEYGFTWLLTCETVVFYSEKALDYQKFSLNLQHFVLVIDRHGCSWIRGYIRGSVPDSAEIYRTGLGLYSQQRAALQWTYLCFNQDWPQTPFAISIAMSLN